MTLLLTQSLVYVPALGGANKSNRMLLEVLAARGHRCVAVAPASEPGRGEQPMHDELRRRGVPIQSTAARHRFLYEGVDVRACRDRSTLREELRACAAEVTPDWLLVSSEDPAQTLLEGALDAAPGRVVYLARTTLALPFGPHAVLPSATRTALLGRAAGVACVSEYLVAYFKRWAGLDATALPISLHGSGPFPDYGTFDRGFVTLINPCAMKGLSILLDLARRMPAVSFAVVPTWGTTAADLTQVAAQPNVTVLPASANVDTVFAQSRVLLVPSLVVEAKARVILEALLRGVPVLASDVGGNREAMLGLDYLLPVAPILQYHDDYDERRLPRADVPAQDIDPWYRALHAVLTDRDRYQQLSRDGRRAAAAYVADQDPSRVEAYLQALSPQHDRPTARQIDESGGRDVRPETRDAIVAALLARRRGRRAAPALDAPEPTRPAAALSSAQRRLWFVHQTDPTGGAYHCSVARRLTGPVSYALVHQALRAIVHRHEILRTLYRTQDGQPRPFLADPPASLLSVIDLSMCSPVAAEAAWQARVATDRAIPFALDRGPLLRAVLTRLGDDEHLLLLTLHHIVADAWSTGILESEFSAIYAALQRGEAPRLPSLQIQYADYAAWQQAELGTPRLDAQRRYWWSTLAGCPQFELPADGADSAAGLRMVSVGFTYPAIRARALGARCREDRATTFMGLLAAYVVVLSVQSGRTRVVTGTDVAGRNHPGAEPLIGCFVNQLVLVVSLDEVQTLRDLLQRCRTTTLEALEHQDLPFDEIVRGLGRDRTYGQMPFFDCKLVLRNVPRTALGLPGVVASSIVLPAGAAQYQLTWTLADLDEGLIGSFDYDPRRLSPARVDVMRRQLEDTLDEMARDPDQPLADVRRRLAAIAAATDRQAPSSATRGRRARWDALRAARSPATTAPSGAPSGAAEARSDS